MTASQIKDTVDPSIIRGFSTLNPWKSVVWIALQWGYIIFAIMVVTKLPVSWYFLLPIYILAVMWVGARQHALAILMHEGAHYRLFKNKIFNDCISDIFLAWPLLITTRRYRESHLAHHRYLNTEKDPDWVIKLFNAKESTQWQFPSCRSHLIIIMLKDMLGLNTLQLLTTLFRFTKNKTNTTKHVKLFTFFRITYYLAIGATITYFKSWHIILLFWVVPMLTWFKVILRIRSIAEHFAIMNKSKEYMSRTTYPSFFDRCFIASLNIWYHMDHHLYPSVPFYNLAKLHKQLLNDKSYIANTHITQGYLGVLKECIKPRLNSN